MDDNAGIVERFKKLTATTSSLDRTGRKAFISVFIHHYFIYPQNNRLSSFISTATELALCTHASFSFTAPMPPAPPTQTPVSQPLSLHFPCSVTPTRPLSRFASPCISASTPFFLPLVACPSCFSASTLSISLALNPRPPAILPPPFLPSACRWSLLPPGPPPLLPPACPLFCFHVRNSKRSETVHGGGKDALHVRFVQVDGSGARARRLQRRAPQSPSSSSPSRPAPSPSSFLFLRFSSPSSSSPPSRVLLLPRFERQ